MVAAVIKHQRLDSVKKALNDLDIHGMTIVDVKGYGRQKGHVEVYRGSEYVVNFLPKIKIEVAVPKEDVDKVVAAIIASARSGEDGAGVIGDGKIFIYDLENVYRIRTGDTGKEAI